MSNRSVIPTKSDRTEELNIKAAVVLSISD